MWLGRGKGKGFYSPCAFHLPRGLKNRKRKDPGCGLAKRVRSCGYRVEGFLTSAGARRIYNIQYPSFPGHHSQIHGNPTEVISKGLRHNSLKTTHIYLKSFTNSVLDEANEMFVS